MTLLPRRFQLGLFLRRPAPERKSEPRRPRPGEGSAAAVMRDFFRVLASLQASHAGAR